MAIRIGVRRRRAALGSYCWYIDRYHPLPCYLLLLESHLPGLRWRRRLTKPQLKRDFWSVSLFFLSSTIAADEMEIIRTKYPDLLKQINKSPLGFLHDLSDKSIWKATPEERDAFWEYLYKQKGFAFWISNYKIKMFREKWNEFQNKSRLKVLYVNTRDGRQ